MSLLCQYYLLFGFIQDLEIFFVVSSTKWTILLNDTAAWRKHIAASLDGYRVTFHPSPLCIFSASAISFSLASWVSSTNYRSPERHTLYIVHESPVLTIKVLKDHTLYIFHESPVLTIEVLKDHTLYIVHESPVLTIEVLKDHTLCIVHESPVLTVVVLNIIHYTLFMSLQY